ncbi:hypothetical protein JCM14469_04660 [Desulfatiferula olefinivorans]
MPGCDKPVSFVLFVFFRERSDRLVEWFDHEAHEDTRTQRKQDHDRGIGTASDCVTPRAGPGDGPFR